MLKLNTNWIGFAQLAISLLMGTGGMIAYVESRFASKESVLTESLQRQADTKRIEGAISDQGKEIHEIYTYLINNK